MLKPKSKLHQRMLKIAKVLVNLIFVFAFFFVLFHGLELVLLKQSHLQLYAAATYYTSIVQKWTLYLTMWSLQSLMIFLGIWLIILLFTYPIKNKKLESETKS